jgi:hypothetical protein
MQATSKFATQLRLNADSETQYNRNQSSSFEGIEADHSQLWVNFKKEKSPGSAWLIAFSLGAMTAVAATLLAASCL